MPELAQFNDRDDKLQPTEAGQEADVQAGRRIGSFYDQAGRDLGQNIKETGTDFQDHVTMSQMSHGSLTMAAGLNDLDNQWNEISKDPNALNDPTVRQKFMQEKVAPFVQQWSQGFSTKQGQMFAAQHSAVLIQHFNEKTIADMSTMAGIAAKVNVQKTSLFNQNTAYGDSSTVDTANGMLDATVENTLKSGNITGVQAEQLRAWAAGEKGKTLIAGYKGDADRAAANTDPVSGAAQIAALKARLQNDTRFSQYGEGGEDESNGAQGGVLEYINHAEEVQGRVVKAQAETVKAAAVASGSQDYANLTVQLGDLRRNGQGPTPDLVGAIDAYAKKYGSVPELASHVETLETQASESQKDVIDHTFQTTNPSTVSDLYTRGNLASGTPGRATQNDWDYHYNVAKDISKSDYDQGVASLDRRARDPEYEAGEKSLDQWLATNLKPKFGLKGGQDLDTGTGQVDINGTGAPPNASVVYADAIRYAHQVFMSNVNAGMSPNDALQRMTDFSGGHSLFAHMPYWQAALGSPNAAQYLGSHPQTEVEGAPIPPAKFNPKTESVAAYRKRIGL